MFLNKIVILCLIVSTCNSTEYYIYPKYNSNDKHNIIKQFYKQQSKEISDNKYISTQSEQEPDLITQIKCSQIRLSESINNLMSTANNNTNTIIELLRESAKDLTKNIKININTVKFNTKEKIDQLSSNINTNVITPIIKSIDNNTNLILDTNKTNMMKSNNDILCDKICSKLTESFTKILQDNIPRHKHKIKGILKNKLPSKKLNKFSICSDIQLNIFSKKNKIRKKIMVKKVKEHSTVNDSTTTSSHKSSISSFSQTQDTYNKLDEILQNNNKLFECIGEVQFLLSINQNKIITQINKSNDIMKNTISDNMNRHENTNIELLKCLEQNITKKSNKSIINKLNNNSKLIIDSNKNIIPNQCEIVINKSILSEAINDKLLHTLNDINKKYSEIENHYKVLYENINNNFAQHKVLIENVINNSENILLN